MKLPNDSSTTLVGWAIYNHNGQPAVRRVNAPWVLVDICYIVLLGRGWQLTMFASEKE